MAAKKKQEPRTGTNKSAFIRQHPGIPAAEVVAKAKEAGITLDAALVYAIRSSDKKQAGGAPKKAASAKAPEAASLGGLDGYIRQLVREAVREELRAIFSKL